MSFKPARCRIGKQNRRITFGFFLLMRSLEALGDVVVLMSAAFYQPSVVNCRKILLHVLPTSLVIRTLCRRDKLIASFISKNRQACFEAWILDCLAVCCCCKNERDHTTNAVVFIQIESRPGKDFRSTLPSQHALSQSMMFFFCVHLTPRNCLASLVLENMIQ